MSFTSILQEIVENCGGGLGAALMGNDGIPIEEITAAGADGEAASPEIALLGVEFGRVLEEVRKASDSVGGGVLRESVLSLSRFLLIFQPVDEETFLLLALAPDGNLGKARYLMRRQMLALRQEL